MQSTFYVAPQALGQANGSAAEHALGSVAKAVELARKQGGYSTIVLLKGQHRLTSTLCLTEQDCNLTIVGQEAVLSATAPITHWRDEGDGVISAPVAAEVSFNQLFVNGVACERTRWPETGHFESKQLVPRVSTWLANMTPEQQQVGRRLMFFHPGDIPENLYRQEDVEFVVLQYWVATRGLKIDTIDHQKGEVVFHKESFRPYNWSFGYYLENVREGLNVPGRWYHDHGKNRVYYHLQPGQTLQNVQITRPVLRTLIQAQPAEGKSITNLHFSGITFTGTDAHPAGQAHFFPQAELTAPVALELTGVQNCSFKRCNFENLGGYALWLRQGCTHCEVDRNTFTHCAAGAVRIGESKRSNGMPDGNTTEGFTTKYDTSINQTPKKSGHVTVTNNRISDCGWYYHGSAGLWVGHSGHNVIAHNDISGPLQWAVSVGWVWDIFPVSQTDSNKVEKNFIHEIGTGMLGTHGAIYMLGVSPNTTVSGNFIRNVYSTPYWGAGEGIILDNCCCGITVQNNVVMYASAGGWGCNFDCFGNIIRNNIFCYGEKFQLTRYGDPPKTATAPPNGEVFTQNIVLWRDGPLFGEQDWLNFSTFWDYNLYWRTSGAADFMGRDFEAWKQLGMDVHSVVADPMFVNPEQGDFCLNDASPAYQIGFEPFSLNDVGILAEPESL